MKKKLRIIVVSIITLILAIIVTICAIVVQNKSSENVPEAVNLTESTTGTESKIYATETTTNESTIGETTSVEKTTIEETTKTIETTTKKEQATSSVTTTKAAETTTKKSVRTTTKPASEKSDLPDYQPDYSALNMFDKVNNYRAKNGVNRMILDDELCKMAYIRAKEQAVKKGHERPDGRRFFSIADDHDYDYTSLGENIARGSYNASDRMFVMWQESASHNENMLDKEWTRSGMAFYETVDGLCIYVQLFAY